MKRAVLSCALLLEAKEISLWFSQLLVKIQSSDGSLQLYQQLATLEAKVDKLHEGINIVSSCLIRHLGDRLDHASMFCQLLIGTGPISVPLTTVDVNSIPQAVWNLLQRDRCPKSMVSELHVLFEVCQFQTTQFLLNCLTVQGARRTSGSSTEICSVLQPMHTVCKSQWVLGSRKGWTWLAGLPDQQPPSYVCFHCFLAGNTELWSWNWGTPSHDCCCKLLGSKQICLPHEQKKCSMRASMHRPITISQDKSVMSCGEHVTHPRRSQLTVFKLGFKILSFLFLLHPGTWYFVRNCKASQEAHRDRQVLDFSYMSTCTSLSHRTQSSNRWSI